MDEAASLDGGFADPVFDAQAVFRALMDAMARPGSLQALAQRTAPPAPLSPSAAAVALALCDQDTPLWLDPALRRADAVRAWLAFHTGAPLTASPAEARFALAAEPASLPQLAAFGQGTQDYPDRSTTLILQVERLGAGGALRLEGPGIKDVAELAAHPLPTDFVVQWEKNKDLFPRGVDLVLCGDGQLAALPRTTRVTTRER